MLVFPAVTHHVFAVYLFRSLSLSPSRSLGATGEGLLLSWLAAHLAFILSLHWSTSS